MNISYRNQTYLGATKVSLKKIGEYNIGGRTLQLITLMLKVVKLNIMITTSPASRHPATSVFSEIMQIFLTFIINSGTVLYTLLKVESMPVVLKAGRKKPLLLLE